MNVMGGCKHTDKRTGLGKHNARSCGQENRSFIPPHSFPHSFTIIHSLTKSHSISQMCVRQSLCTRFKISVPIDKPMSVSRNYPCSLLDVTCDQLDWYSRSCLLVRRTVTLYRSWIKRVVVTKRTENQYKGKCWNNNRSYHRTMEEDVKQQNYVHAGRRFTFTSKDVLLSACSECQI